RPAEMWVCPRKRQLSNERPAKCAEGYRFGFASDVAASVKDAGARSFESSLAYLELRRHSDRRQARHRNGSSGNTSAAIRHFETKAVCQGVTPCLVHFDNDVFCSLIGDRPPRFDFSPIENSRRIQAAFRRKKISFRQGRPCLDLCNFSVDYSLFRVIASDG